MTIPVIIDTDPGIDDVIAILLALASPELDVIGITTVNGNTTLANTTANALRTVELAGRADVPVAAGADRPLIRLASRHGGAVHGTDGLGGVDLPPPAHAPVPDHAADFIADRLRTSPKPVTIIAIGPLTNIALLLAMHPDAGARLGRLVVMGGAARGGNVTPAAEFNVWVDPEAAHRVFTAGLEPTMVGLDVTHHAIIRPSDVAGLRTGGRIGRTVAGAIDFYSRFHADHYGTPDTYQHDALAVAEVIRPGIVRTRRLHVEVDDSTGPGRGATIVDIDGVTGGEPNTDVALEIDRSAFTELLTGRLADLDARVGP